MKKAAYTPKEVIKMLNDLSNEFQATSKDIQKDEKSYVKDGDYYEAADCKQASYTIEYAASRLNQLVLTIKSESK